MQRSFVDICGSVDLDCLFSFNNYVDIFLEIFYEYVPPSTVD
jgi:hypothetical protein